MSNQPTRIESLIDFIKTELIIGTAHVNNCIKNADIARNLVNYGRMNAYADVLGKLGVRTTIAHWKTEDGYMQIEHLAINGKIYDRRPKAE